MPIPASYIVAINPRLIQAGGNDLEFNGLIITKNNVLPLSAMVSSFPNADAVGEYFGLDSIEYKLAAKYFLGYNNSFAKPKRLMFAPRVSEDVAAWIRGGKYKGTLAQVKAINNGGMKITINGTEYTLSGVDFSGATSFSDAAAVLQVALDAELSGVTVEYSSLTKAFQINSPGAGAAESITFAETAPGQDLAILLNLTEDSGAILSQGADAMTPAQNMAAVKAATQNWVSFTTTYEPTDEEHLGFAQWATDEGIDYLYVGWSSDVLLTTQGSTTSIADVLKDAEVSATALVYDNAYVAVFVLGMIASIDWERYQGTINLAFKKVDGVAATVTDAAEADILKEKGVSYIGNFATRNDDFTFFYDAQIFGDYHYIDTFINTIWLKNVMQVAVMNGLTSAGRVPYNDRGYTLIRAWLQDPVNRAVNNGCIDPGVALSESQKAQIFNETGKDLSNELWTLGYAIIVEDAGASVRVGRQSPNISVYYTYGGSVNRIEVASTALV